MFSVMESNIGYVAGGAGATAAGGSTPYMRRREIYQHVPVLSYTQMLRMSMEEDGAEDIGSSINASREPCCNFVQVKQERAEEGYAESDYDFTCLTLGLVKSACDVTSSRVENTHCNVAGSVECRSSSGFTRTCTLCGTSKTPLWRSGPMGAKSLCNACGIRSKKAKKLAAASSAGFDKEQIAGNFSYKKSLTMLKHAATAGSSKKMAKRKLPAKEEEMENQQQYLLVKKKKKQQLEQQQQQQQLQQKQRASLRVDIISSPVKTESSSCVTSRGTSSPCSTSDQRKAFASSSTAMLSPSSASCNQIRNDVLFPKDEEQAAFLLMALSCGLVLAN